MCKVHTAELSMQNCQAWEWMLIWLAAQSALQSLLYMQCVLHVADMRPCLPVSPTSMLAMVTQVQQVAAAMSDTAL